MHPDQQIIHHFSLSIAIAGILVFVTATVHFIGLSILAIWMLTREWNQKTHEVRPLWRRYLAILWVVFGLFGMHTIEIWLYALLYRYGLEAFPDLEQSLYFSTITFVSLGNGDVVMPRAWRLVGAIEAVNGVVLLGWSTAFFITVVSRLRVLEHEWLENYRPKHDNQNAETQTKP